MAHYKINKDILYDVSIIGGGVIGSGIARELSKYKLKIALIDKENDVAEGISKANSGVIHAGFNVKPGSLKARFNKEGVELLPKIADELGVKYKICKKLVIAKTKTEKESVYKLYEQGKKNSTTGLSIIGSSEIKKLARGVNGECALYSEKTGIITPYLFTIALAENACENGVDVILSTPITQIKKDKNDSYTLFTNGNVVCQTKWVVNSTGLFSDKTANMVEKCSLKIHPCRGEYYIIDKNVANLLEMAIYPVPNLDGSSLGVHLTPTLNGNILIGPSADYINSRIDVSNTRAAMEQLKKEAFALMPQLIGCQFIKNFSGIRPKLFNSEKNINFEDFYILESAQNPRFVNLIGIESPGLTSAPAIAKYVTENIIAAKQDLVPKQNFYPGWDGCTKFIDLTMNEKIRVIKQNSDFGQIVCRCEQITKGEIIKALNNPFNARSLSAIKKRTHALSGRCQGGFCTSRIMKILTEEFKLKESEILKTNKGSNLLYVNK